MPLATKPSKGGGREGAPRVGFSVIRVSSEKKPAKTAKLVLSRGKERLGHCAGHQKLHIVINCTSVKKKS